MSPRTLVAFLAMVSLLAGSSRGAHAQPDNRGAVLYLTLAPEIVYDDTTSYRGKSALAPPDLAITEAPADGRVKVAFLMLAFPEEAEPEVNLVTFGLQYPSGVRVVRSEWTPECLQIGTWNWPKSRQGLSIAYLQKPDTTDVVELGWIAFRASAPSRVAAAPHIDARMAGRIVAQTPPDQVPIAAYGTIGFGMDGSVPRPSLPGPDLGATCFEDDCLMITRAEAEYYRGDVVFLGEGVVCGAESYCRADAPQGACCLPDGRCEVRSRRECMRDRGRYVGNNAPCTPDACAGAKPSTSPPTGSMGR